MDNKKFRVGIICGVSIIFITETLVFNENTEKLHKNPHLAEGGFAHEQLLNYSSTSGMMASASISIFESEHLKNTNLWKLFNN